MINDIFLTSLKVLIQFWQPTDILQQFMNQVLQGGGEEKTNTCEKKLQKKVYTFDKRSVFCVDSKYKLSEIKGRGVYGVVAEAQNIQTKQKVAVKLIKDLFRTAGEAKRQLRQIKILKFLKHKNIVGLLDIMRIQDKDSFNQVYLVLQYMQYNLKRFIQSKNPIHENMIKFIIYQILEGLYYMHSADIIHRDIKPQNILINSKLYLKIADMNLARKEDDNPTQYVVTRPYRALEVFLCSKNYTKSIDIWSAGCILGELIGRTVLFEGKDYLDQLKRFVAILGKPNLDYYDDVDETVKQNIRVIFQQIPDRSKIQWSSLFPNSSKEALDLLDHMLEYDPKKRYTAQECLNHPYLKELRQKNKPIKCEKIFDFAFDSIPMNVQPSMQIQALRNAIYEEAKAFEQEFEEKRARPKTQGTEKDDQQGKPRKMLKFQ